MNGKKGNLTVKAVKSYFYVEGEGTGEMTSIDGRKLKKVYTNKPQDVPKEREKYRETWEADIPFVFRNWIDSGYYKYIDEETLKPVKEEIRPRKCYIDIEVDDSAGFPDPEQAGEQVLSIVFYDTYFNYYNILTYKKVDTFKFLEKIGKLNFKLRLFDNEEEMLRSFYRYISDRDTAPDVILGWNVAFDYDYLTTRMAKFGLRLNRNEYCIFDLMTAYERLHENDIESLSLEYVATLELGRGKVKRKERVKDLWDKDVVEEIYYNYTDVALLVELEEKLKMFDFFFTLSETAGTLEISRWNASYIADSFLLHRLHGKMALPTTVKHEKASVQGATVLPPSNGVFENVVVFDFRSEYPSIIYTFNLSPDTLNGGTELGVIPQIVGYLVEERLKIKNDPTKANQQRVLKEITNSFYGLFGDEGYRLYNPDIQAKITYYAREHLVYIKDKIEQSGRRVLYGDTDSVFVEWGKKIDEGEITSIKQFAKQLNDGMDEFTARWGRGKGMLEVDIDSIFSKWVQTGVKKRYYGEIIYKKNKWTNELYSRGFELRRSNTSLYTKKKQRELMLKSFEGKDTVIQWYKNELDAWENRRLSTEEIALISGAGKDIEEYKVESQLKKAIIRGRKEKLVTTASKKYKIYLLADGEIALDFFDELPKAYVDKIDWEAHKRRCLTLPMEKILNLFFDPSSVNFTLKKSQTLMQFLKN
ncbi:MAG: DNA polymerase domain-containing protein [Candidatus Kryptoniota bacterium]